ncbi:MAG: DUF1646 family protein [Endomicrobiales bacterium]
MLELSLIAIILLVLVLPVTVHAVEKNLEPFLLLMGVLAVSFSHLWGSAPVWSVHLAGEALTEPLMITAAVTVVGIALYYLRAGVERFIASTERFLGEKLFAFAVVAGLGVFSSVITAIMAAILLVEVITILRHDRETELKLVVLGCFSIGLGAALTPVGEPLSTITIAKLRGEPYHAGFFFLFAHLGPYILPGILSMGALGSLVVPSNRRKAGRNGLKEKDGGTLADVFTRAAKVYLFIVALVLLGKGFTPIVDRYVVALPGAALYWINTLSAVMDNATLAAAEISPRMTLGQLQYVLMGLLVAGGMLIPGNIPNIIAAGRLRIRSKEWAKWGIPLGALLMLAYFVVFEFIL